MTESNMIRRYIIEFDDEGKAINLHRIYPKKGPERLSYPDVGHWQHILRLCDGYEEDIDIEGQREHASGHKSDD